MSARTAALIAIAAMLWVRPATAHDPNLSSLRLYDAGTEAAIELYVPTAGIEAAFAARFGDDLPLTSQAGKERVVAYVRESVSLVSPGGAWTFGGGGIRVGSHETVVRLEVVAPEGPRLPLDVRAPLFAESPRSRVTFRYADPTGELRATLTADNGFTARIRRVEELPEDASPE